MQPDFVYTLVLSLSGLLFICAIFALGEISMFGALLVCVYVLGMLVSVVAQFMSDCMKGCSRPAPEPQGGPCLYRLSPAAAKDVFHTKRTCSQLTKAKRDVEEFPLCRTCAPPCEGSVMRLPLARPTRDTSSKAEVA